MTYEREFMVTQEEKYYTGVLENLIEHNDRTKTPLSKEKIQQAINTIVIETKEEGCNANNATTGTFVQPPVTTNASRKKA